MTRKLSTNLEDIVRKGEWRRQLPQELGANLSLLLNQIQAVDPPRRRKTLREDFNRTVAGFLRIQNTVNDIVRIIPSASSGPLMTVAELRQAITGLSGDLQQK